MENWHILFAGSVAGAFAALVIIAAVFVWLERNTPLKVGDLVQHKTDTQTMVIISIDRTVDASITCLWKTNTTTDYMERKFRACELERVSS